MCGGEPEVYFLQTSCNCTPKIRFLIYAVCCNLVDSANGGVVYNLEYVIDDLYNVPGVIGFAVTSYTFIENEGIGMVTVMGPVDFSGTLSVLILGG